MSYTGDVDREYLYGTNMLFASRPEMEGLGVGVPAVYGVAGVVLTG